MGVITLLTDFGTRDEYVGVMKGVILGLNPTVSVVDICHRIPPHDVRAAGDMIQSAYRYFPPGTVHTVVVDPGVGGQRAVIAFAAVGHFFLGPDNGVFSRILSGLEADEIVRVENPAYFLSPLSNTFHGRDIFAPVAAGLSLDSELARLGRPVRRRELVRLAAARLKREDDGQLIGEVVGADRFGNLITNIGSADLACFSGKGDNRVPLFTVGGCRIHGLSACYDAAVGGKPIAVVGSRGVVEIAVNRASALRALSARIGDPVEVVWVTGEGLRAD